MAEEITQRANELASLSVFADCFGADLYHLATVLQPLSAAPGEVLMRQGEKSDFFLVINSGSVLITHAADEGPGVTIEVGEGLIVGEIGLLKHSVRVATVTAADDLTGWVGDRDAFEQLVDLPGVLPILVRTARQRLAAFITPVPIRLRDGTALLLRPVLPGDSARATSGHVEFSTETLYRRFMSARRPSEALMQYLFEVDYVDHFVWVVIDEDDGDVVADARFVRDEADPTSAEIAFIVGDAFQGRRIGSFLMKALVIAAHVGGITRFTARVLSGNLPMRHILDEYGAVWKREDLGVVTTVIEVPDESSVRLPRRLAAQIRGTARQAMTEVS
ncbi:GNAT family N-acetyltransferase [Mycolicibacterium palauense]|uniref:GNAT family N-acetyltransferase n=1 Tax=Mycolicibacterium palauense TaxID=2034511 RepID=UPI001FEBD2CE|nr:GNAT family N-acetyltransferase [Mycolicibacterium palauense]